MNTRLTFVALCGAGILACAPFLVQAIDVNDSVGASAEMSARAAASTNVYTGVTDSVTASSVALVPSNYRICRLLTRSLVRGSQGDDVSGLQEYLHDQGYLSVNATGYFGSLTEQALQKWQANNGVVSNGSAATTGWGRFGPATRARFKNWCGGPVDTGNVERFNATPTSGSAPLTVAFNTWLSGFRINTISYEIDYGDGATERAADCYAPADACLSPGTNTHTYAANGTYTALLKKITNTCPPGAMCFVGPTSEVVAQQQITVGSSACRPLTYMPIACSDGSQAQPQHNEEGCLIGYECPVANFTPPATCKAWNDGCNVCSRTSPTSAAMCTLRACFAAGKGYCSVYFDNPSTGGNQAPTISGFSGPTALSINQTGTWTIQAADPENGTLSYNVTWGDENHTPFMDMMAMASEQQFTQTTTFTHSYSSSGYFSITIVVRDSTGNEAKTSTTVHIGTDNVICTQEYVPVCGQPAEPACRHTPPYCMIATPGPQTYGNRCMMNAAGATFLYSGQCQNNYSGGTACTADAMQCPDGSYVGRTGPNCTFVCPGTTNDQGTTDSGGASCIYNGQTYQSGGTRAIMTGTCASGQTDRCTTTYVCRDGQWAI